MKYNTFVMLFETQEFNQMLSENGPVFMSPFSAYMVDHGEEFYK